MAINRPAGLFFLRFVLVCWSVGGTLLFLEVGLRLTHRFLSRPSPAEQLHYASHVVPPLRRGHVCRSADEQPFGALVQPSRETEIVYEFKPDLDTCGWGGHHVQTNHAGLRAIREYALAKPKGTWRILGLGDSVMFGLGVNNDDSYSLKIEQRLSRSLGRPVEFINTAVPGYNTAIEAAVLEMRGLRYAPDLIILHWCSNDFGVPFFLQRPKQDLSLRWAFLNFLQEHWTRLRSQMVSFGIKDWSRLVQVPGELLDKPDLDRIPAEYHWMVGPAGVTRALDQIKTLTSWPRHIPVVIVVQHFANLYWPPNLLKYAFVSRGFIVVQVDNPPEWWLSPADQHLNAKGHEGHAIKIIEALAALDLLPKVNGR